MKSLKNLKQILDEIISVLSIAGESNWNSAIKNFRSRCDLVSDSNDQKELIADLIRIFGGMGSFSDLVLYNQGNLMQRETMQLDALRTKLFEAAKKLL
jgi:hypothetical protein